MPNERQTHFEQLIVDACDSDSIIVGAPWVNPSGRSRARISAADLLSDPLILRRLLAVAFSHRDDVVVPDVAVIAAASMAELDAAKSALGGASTSALDLKRIVWCEVFDQPTLPSGEKLDVIIEEIKQKDRQ